MPISAVCQRNPRHKRPQRRRQAHQRHQRGNAHHQKQREHRKHLAHTAFDDDAKHIRQQITHHQHNQQNRCHAHNRHNPTGLMRQQIASRMPAFPFFRNARSRQKRHQRQHRNRRHILKQQHRKPSLPTSRLHQLLLVIRLQHNRRGRQRQNTAHRHANLPFIAQSHRDARNRRHRKHNLQTTQPQQFMPQLPQHLRRKLQAHQKQHHYHTKFCNMLNRFRFLANKM